MPATAATVSVDTIKTNHDDNGNIFYVTYILSVTIIVFRASRRRHVPRRGRGVAHACPLDKESKDCGESRHP